MSTKSKGFEDVGDILREARATKQVVASGPRTAAIDEPALFPRPAEKEKLQRADGPGPWVEGCDRQGTDSETTLAMRPAPVAEESTERKSESTADIFRSGKLEHAQAQAVIKQLLRASKTLPEIKDPLPVVVPEFHPGSVFVARITSSRKNLEALILVVLLVFAGIAAFLIPQLRKSLADGREDAVTKTTNLPTESSDPVAGFGTNVSGTVETPSAATTESKTTAPPSKDFEETTADTKSVASTPRFESAEVSEKGSTGIDTAPGSESRAHPWSGNRNPEPSENKREFSPATSMSHSAAPAHKQRAVSRPVKFKQQTVADEQPKPAPLSGEMSQSHSDSTPARSANEVSGSQPPPLRIISGKPKSKVIQWP